ncbi:hypothetical protein CC80DRAFT_533692 [Byssothecium circinans]|uniref:Uncharacterized protein n=1 Tax=Byssothecium circinans TaxID=147558 RepID=A0A6A5U2X3_9PLEO|nr:hypothetical protein CC80DRAFT_533692 [Byssothecium circinans]
MPRNQPRSHPPRLHHTHLPRPNSTSTFHEICHCASIPSVPQPIAITSLAYCIPDPNEYFHHNADTFIANALLPLPNLAAAEVRRETGGNSLDEYVHDEQLGSGEMMKPARAPMWWFMVMKNVRNGPSFRWQSGGKGRVEWIHEEDACAKAADTAFKTHDKETLEQAIKAAAGVECRACKCGALSWTTTVLVQNKGKRVNVGFVYSASPRSPVDQAKERRREFEGHRIKLVPGAELLEVESLEEMSRVARDEERLTGFGWGGEV